METKRVRPKQVVVSVSTVSERDKLIKQIYTNLTKEPDTRFTVLKDQVNRVQVFHNVGINLRVLIRTYLVVIIPVLVDLSPVTSIIGDLHFHLDETIKDLTALINRLQTLQGHHIIKGSTNAETIRQLARGLCEINGEH